MERLFVKEGGGLGCPSFFSRQVGLTDEKEHGWGKEVELFKNSGETGARFPEKFDFSPVSFYPWVKKGFSSLSARPKRKTLTHPDLEAGSSASRPSSCRTPDSAAPQPAPGPGWVARTDAGDDLTHIITGKATRRPIAPAEEVLALYPGQATPG